MNAKEYSAGGVVTKEGKVLLIKMRTLAGDLVWTFPKGHLDKGETPREAALREVFEETGYECAVRKTLALIRYSFVRKKRKVNKRVRWYWMESRCRTGKPDPDEIFGMKWLSYKKAKKRLRYPADLRLIEKAKALARAGGRT